MSTPDTNGWLLAESAPLSRYSRKTASRSHRGSLEMIHPYPVRRRAGWRWWLAPIAALLTFSAQASDRYWPPIVDPATGQHTPGRFVWGDLVTADVAAAADFYGRVFGWTFETYGGKDDRDTYTLALADGLPIGGMVFDQRAMKGKTPSARWVGLHLRSGCQGGGCGRHGRRWKGRSRARRAWRARRNGCLQGPGGRRVRRRQLEEWRSARLCGRRQ